MSSPRPAPAPPPRRAGRRRPIVGAALVLAVGAGLLLASRPAGNAGAPPEALQQAELLEKAGVRLVRVAVTGGGGLVDLRYQVVDASKALAVHDPKTPPALIARGRLLTRPFMGHLPHNVPQAGRTYYVIFENTRYAVRRGRAVTVELAGVRLEDVAVG